MEAQSKQEKRPKESRKALAFFIFLCFVLAFLPLFLPGTYCLGFEHDEGLFLVVAREIANGKVLYLDITDNKLPLLYYLLIPATHVCGTDFMCYRSLSMGLNFIISLIIFASCRHHLKGIAKYAPPIAYLVYSIAGMNFFIGTIQIFLFLWAVSFFTLSEFLIRPRNSMLLLFGATLGASAMIKPTAPLVLALPAMYVFLHEKNKKQMLFWIFCGFLATALLISLALLPLVHLPGLLLEGSSWLPGLLFPSQNYNANVQAAPLGEIFPFYLGQLALFAFLAVLIFMPAIPMLFQKSRTKFEIICGLFLLCAFAVIASKTFSLSLHAGLFPVFFLPLSLVIGTVFGNMLSDFKLILAHLIMAAFFFLTLISLFVIISQIPNSEMYVFSTSHLECGWMHGAASYLRTHSNGTFFVFPSRPGYYLVLDKHPIVRMLAHNQIAFTLPKSDQWFEKNVFGPLQANPPDTILLFDEPFDERSEKGENLKYNEFREYLASNYSLAYNSTNRNITSLIYMKK